MVRRGSLAGLLSLRRRGSTPSQGRSSRGRLEHQDSLELLRQQRAAAARRASLPAPPPAAPAPAAARRRHSTSSVSTEGGVSSVARAGAARAPPPAAAEAKAAEPAAEAKAAEPAPEPAPAPPPASDAFSMARCLYFARVVRAAPGHALPEPFLDLCREIAKIFSLLGRGMGFAASQIAEYVEIVDVRMANLDSHPRRAAGREDSVQDLVLVEKAEGRADTGPGVGKASAARTVLRLMWFFDFTQALAANVAADRSRALGDSAADAYQRTLRQHHPWIVRKAVSAALYALPARDDFLLRVGAVDPRTQTPSVQAAFEGLGQLAQEMAPISEDLWGFYREEGLEGLR